MRWIMKLQQRSSEGAQGLEEKSRISTVPVTEKGQSVGTIRRECDI